MPYANVPESKWGKMDRCVERVMANQPDLTKSRAVAICHKSVMGDDDERGFRTTVVAIPIREIPGRPGRYRAYAVRFTGPEERDAYGTYFDAQTDYRLDYYEKWPWLHHHGRHSKIGPRKVGVWDERGIDEQGVFVEGEMDAHARYKEALQTLIGEQILFTSSQALSSMVRVAEDGHMELWPIGEVSSTVTPADYRQSPISAAAMRAIEVLNSDRDGGQTMPDEKKTAGQQFLAGLANLLGVDVTFPGATAEGADDTPPEANVASAEERITPEPAAGEPQERKPMTLDDVATRVGEQLELPAFRIAIEKLDGAVKGLTERLKAVEEIAQKVGATEPARVQEFLEGPEWLSKLFVGSRDADPVSKAEADAAKAEGAPAAAAGVPEGSTVFKAIQDSQQPS
jgi:hypothetical protein